MFNPRIVALWLGLVCALGPRSVYASCYKFEVERAFRESSAVFIGRVLESDVRDVKTVATFQVTQSWKGSEQRTIPITTCGGSYLVCNVGNDFVVGHEYLVFAYGDPLRTSACDTAEVAASSSKLKWLQSRPSKKLANTQMQPTRRGSLIGARLIWQR